MFCVSQAHHINTLCGHLACFSEKASLLWQLWLSVWSCTPDWEERIKKHSPSWPEKCHASLLNLPLTKRQLRTRRRTQGGAVQEVAGLVGEFRMPQRRQRMCEARDAVCCGCDCCLQTVQGAACTACPCGTWWMGVLVVQAVSRSPRGPSVRCMQFLSQQCRPQSLWGLGQAVL